MNPSPSATPETATPRELAERLGFKPHYGNQLLKEGRFVVDPGNPRRVLVAESIAHYEATKDPSKAGVAARHAAARAGQGADAQAAPPDAAAEAGSERYNYQGSKAKREHFAALEAEASYRQKMRELLEAEDVRSVLAEILTVLRKAIESQPYRRAPELAAMSDEAQIRAVLVNDAEALLKDASAALSKLGRGEF